MHGSDQGLVGRCNDVMADLAVTPLVGQILVESGTLHGLDEVAERYWPTNNLPEIKDGGAAMQRASERLSAGAVRPS